MTHTLGAIINAGMLWHRSLDHAYCMETLIACATNAEGRYSKKCHKRVKKEHAYPSLSLISVAVRKCGMGLAFAVSTYFFIIYEVTTTTYRPNQGVSRSKY